MPTAMAHEAEVFRLVSHKDEHFPPNAPKPHPVAFELSSADKKEGLDRNMPPMLSVFDREKTTLEEARTIRRVASGREVETTPFAWSVAAIAAIALPDEQPGRLEVLSDPLIPACPGGDGHGGIVGLNGIGGEKDGKLKKKLLCHKLVDACYRINE